MISIYAFLLKLVTNNVIIIFWLQFYYFLKHILINWSIHYAENDTIIFFIGLFGCRRWQSQKAWHGKVCEYWTLEAITCRAISSPSNQLLRLSNERSICLPGLVFSIADACPRWILRSLRCSRVSPSFMLPGRPPRQGRAWPHGRSCTRALLLCILLQSYCWPHVSSHKFNVVFFAQVFITGSVDKGDFLAF